jgi:hypothetical protein
MLARWLNWVQNSSARISARADPLACTSWSRWPPLVFSPSPVVVKAVFTGW